MPRKTKSVLTVTAFLVSVLLLPGCVRSEVSQDQALVRQNDLPPLNQVVPLAHGVLAATDRGVFYQAWNENSWQIVGLSHMEVHTVAVRANGEIYAGGVDSRTATQDIPFDDTHSLYKSSDGGISWVPVDNGLSVCDRVSCSRMDIFSLAASPGGGDVIFANGKGSNLFVSLNGGQTWQHLLRSANNCYSSLIALSNHSLFQGGECPLDNAFLDEIIFSDSSFRTVVQRQQILGYSMIGNRKINSIYSRDEILWIGMEGAIIEVAHGKAKFVFDENAELGSPLYVYVKGIRRLENGHMIAVGNNGPHGPAVLLHFNGARWAQSSALSGYRITNGGSPNNLELDPRDPSGNTFLIPVRTYPGESRSEIFRYCALLDARC